MYIANVRGRAVLVTGETATGETTGVDIAGASHGRFGPAPADLYGAWDEFLAWAEVAAAGRGAPEGPVVGFTPADLGPPSPTPSQIFAIGLNYRDHADEAGLALPERPTVFTKFASSLSGPDTTVVLPDGEVDWEVELVVVIGRVTRRARVADAWRAVAGLTVGQDISERRLQLSGPAPQFSLAKSHPGFGPTGPHLVTPDELAEPDDLEIGCSVNGEEVQKARTSRLVFGVDELIAHLSAVATLHPGDLIFTGTPSGVGAARTPARHLAPGDELVSYVQGVGTLRQTFVAAGGRA
ncbi:fumarylacetoacetate hydrolase family protein [Streptomyces radicis]|uniref:Fumarylacetoacetate hydrolase family protein n=1 Tax=Streptomyces radicis TaxID=1750517 RepID=A0A3A9VT30_9ACTN|nr:fumarylacetoacetate hydrolase family protein [Streptomyces radicis]RKN04241.1 fumarylacetoacetate hydrolase family protein [Streptomyces radicis]RKN14759.1 fumarylacetoacetate hydrolase family protein [Streptomyces radicis]